jgi:hypothetical protein
VIRGFDSLVDHAQPVINELGTDFTAIGQSVGDAFDTIAGGADESALALHDLTAAITFTVQGTAFLVRGLTEVYGAMAYVSPLGEKLVDLLGGFSGKQDDAGHSAEDLARGLDMSATAMAADAAATERTNQYLADSEKLMQQTAQAARDLTTANQTLYGSETAVGEATDRATAARKKNGQTLDENTEKGRNNREALLGVATAAQREYEAFVRVNGEGPRSAAVGDRLRAAFIKTAESFGLSAGKAKDLANKILGIPPRHDTKINADPRNAVEASKAAKAAINSVHSRTVSVNVNVNAPRLASIENRLNRLGGSMYNAAEQAWQANDPSSGRARTGGPTPVALTSSVAVSLDGRPFREMTAKAIETTNRRRDFRTKVGKRS